MEDGLQYRGNRTLAIGTSHHDHLIFRLHNTEFMGNLGNTIQSKLDLLGVQGLLPGEPVLKAFESQNNEESG